MGILTGLKKLFVAKSNEAEQAIEDKNIISFSEQDLRVMNEELNKAKGNYGSMKATLMQIERDKASKEAELATRISQAKALKVQSETDPAKGEVAIKVAGQCISIKEEIAALTQQQTMFIGKVEQQRKNVETISESISQAKRDLQFMKAQDQVTKSTEALSSVNTDGVQSTLSKFNERKQKMQHKMDTADAMLEAETSNNLDAQIESALGGKKAQSQDFLNSL
jgi:phage shock protein A